MQLGLPQFYIAREFDTVPLILSEQTLSLAADCTRLNRNPSPRITGIVDSRGRNRFSHNEFIRIFSEVEEGLDNVTSTILRERVLNVRKPASPSDLGERIYRIVNAREKCIDINDFLGTFDSIQTYNAIHSLRFYLGLDDGFEIVVKQMKNTNPLEHFYYVTETGFELPFYIFQNGVMLNPKESCEVFLKILKQQFNPDSLHYLIMQGMYLSAFPLTSKEMASLLNVKIKHIEKIEMQALRRVFKRLKTLGYVLGSQSSHSENINLSQSLNANFLQIGAFQFASIQHLKTLEELVTLTPQQVIQRKKSKGSINAAILAQMEKYLMSQGVCLADPARLLVA